MTIDKAKTCGRCKYYQDNGSGKIGRCEYPLPAWILIHLKNLVYPDDLMAGDCPFFERCSSLSMKEILEEAEK